MMPPHVRTAYLRLQRDHDQCVAALRDLLHADLQRLLRLRGRLRKLISADDVRCRRLLTRLNATDLHQLVAAAALMFDQIVLADLETDVIYGGTR